MKRILSIFFEIFTQTDQGIETLWELERDLSKTFVEVVMNNL